MWNCRVTRADLVFKPTEGNQRAAEAAFYVAAIVQGEGAMRLRIPSPRDGWRIFLGEVGVIVLGVLIALGAQELVSDYNMRKAVHAFEETLRKEVGNNLYSYQFRAAQTECINRNVDAMLEWLDKVRVTGISEPIEEFAFPNTIIFYRSAWDNKDPDVFANLPPDRKTRYSEFYDELKNSDQLAWEEIEAWINMFRFSEPGPVSVEERRDAAVALVQIRGFNYLFRNNLEMTHKIAADLQIEPRRPDNMEPGEIDQVKQCATLKRLEKK